MAGLLICIMEWTSRPVHGWEATNRSCTCLGCINFLFLRVSPQLTWPRQGRYYAIIQRKKKCQMSYCVKYKNVHEPDLPVYNRVDWLLISNIYAYIFSSTIPWMVHLIHVSRKGNETLILLRSKGPLRVDRCIHKSTWTAVFQPHALLIQTLSPSEIMINIPPHPLTKLFESASLFQKPALDFSAGVWYSHNVFCSQFTCTLSACCICHAAKRQWQPWLRERCFGASRLEELKQKKPKKPPNI